VAGEAGGEIDGADHFIGHARIGTRLGAASASPFHNDAASLWLGISLKISIC